MFFVVRRASLVWILVMLAAHQVLWAQPLPPHLKARNAGGSSQKCWSLVHSVDPAFVDIKEDPFKNDIQIPSWGRALWGFLIGNTSAFSQRKQAYEASEKNKIERAQLLSWRQQQIGNVHGNTALAEELLAAQYPRMGRHIEAIFYTYRQRIDAAHSLVTMEKMVREHRNYLRSLIDFAEIIDQEVFNLKRIASNETQIIQNQPRLSRLLQDWNLELSAILRNILFTNSVEFEEARHQLKKMKEKLVEISNQKEGDQLRAEIIDFSSQDDSGDLEGRKVRLEKALVDLRSQFLSVQQRNKNIESFPVQSLPMELQGIKGGEPEFISFLEREVEFLQKFLGRSPSLNNKLLAEYYEFLFLRFRHNLELASGDGFNGSQEAESLFQFRRLILRLVQMDFWSGVSHLGLRLHSLSLLDGEQIAWDALNDRERGHSLEYIQRIVTLEGGKEGFTDGVPEDLGETLLDGGENSLAILSRGSFEQKKALKVFQSYLVNRFRLRPQ